MNVKRIIFLTATILFCNSILFQVNGETTKNLTEQPVVTEGQQSSEKIFTSELLRKEVVTALNSEENRIEGSVWGKKDINTYNPSIQDMKLLKKIHIIGDSKENIDTIEGLKYAENLEEIRVSFIDVKSYAGLENLKKLRVLLLSYCKVDDLTEISKATSIEELILRNNNIEDISPLNNLTNLKLLNLSQNNINAIADLSALTKLKELDLSSNKIDMLYGFDEETWEPTYPLNNSKDLEVLDLSNNMLSSDDGLQKFPKLRVLRLSENRELKKINNIKNLKELVILEVIENQLNDLQPISNLKNLRYLTVRGNDIKDVTPLENLTNLEYLHIYDNKVKDIEPLKNLVNLREFNFSKNLVSNLNPLKNMSKLRVLFGYQNNVEDPSPLNQVSSLRVINLAQNNITDISKMKSKADEYVSLVFDNEIIDKKITSKDVEISEDDEKVVITMKNPIVDIDGKYCALDNTKELELLTDGDEMIYMKNDQIKTYNSNINRQVENGVLVKTIKNKVDNDTVEFTLDKNKFKCGSENRLKIYFLNVEMIKAKKWENDFPDFTEYILNGEEVVDSDKGECEDISYNFGGTIQLYLMDDRKDNSNQHTQSTVLDTTSSRPLEAKESFLVGEDRYDTAIKVSKSGWSSSDNVVLINGNSIADALSSTPFAGCKDAPILLTQSNKLNLSTMSEIERLGAKNIYIVGGESSIDSNLEKSLRLKGYNIIRISGNNRYETSLKIAEEINKISNISKISVVNGEKGLADAVSIGSVGAQKCIPIVLTDKMGNTQGIDKIIKDCKVSKLYIVGGKSVLSDSLHSKVENSQRISGRDRNETNIKVMEEFYGEKLNNLYVAKNGMDRQDNLIDALSVGVLAGKNQSPVMLVGNQITDGQKKLIGSKKIESICKIGGKGNEDSFSQIKKLIK